MDIFGKFFNKNKPPKFIGIGLNIGIQLVSPIILMGLIGVLLGNIFGSSKVFLAIFLIIGVISGFILTLWNILIYFKNVNKSNKK